MTNQTNQSQRLEENEETDDDRISSLESLMIQFLKQNMGYKENNADAKNAIGTSVRKMYYAIKGTIHKTGLDTDQQHQLNEKDMELTQEENQYEQEMVKQMNEITKEQIDHTEQPHQSCNDEASNPMAGNLNGVIGTPTMGMHTQMSMMMGNNAMQNQMMMAGGMPNPSMMNPMSPKNEQESKMNVNQFMMQQMMPQNFMMNPQMMNQVMGQSMMGYNGCSMMDPSTEMKRKRNMNVKCGHLNMPHQAKGYCRECYMKEGRRKAYNCPHSTVSLYAKGRCKMCYEQQNRDIRAAEEYHKQKSSMNGCPNNYTDANELHQSNNHDNNTLPIHSNTDIYSHDNIKDEFNGSKTPDKENWNEVE